MVPEPERRSARRTCCAWPQSIEEAKAVQAALGKRVRIKPLTRPLHRIAAMDASYADGKAIGVACLFSWPGLELLEDSMAVRDCTFPYVPGYLSFREGPVLEEAIGKLGARPDLLLFDGQGIAHPLGLGIASHMGVLLGLPSIGCAKSRLVGQYREPGRKKGAHSPLMLPRPGRQSGGKATHLAPVGAVLRTREGVKPVFVSPGHLVDIDDAVRIVIASTRRYRLPEPLRFAHNASQKARKIVIM